MYAVLKTGGKQYRVQPGDTLRVEKLEAEEGTTVRFDQVLMIGGGTDTAIGSPVLDGAAVEAEVLAQIKGEKVISFVRRRRKHSSKRTRGHRQRLTVLRVTGIQPPGGEMVEAQAMAEDAVAVAGDRVEDADVEPAEVTEVTVEDGGRASVPGGIVEAESVSGTAAPSDAVPGTAADAEPGAATADDEAPALDAIADDAEAREAGEAPALLDAPRGEPDDLTRLSGVGPKLSATLNGIGVYHFDQIAEWGEAEIAYMDARLRFKGRIQREGWIEQAKALAAEKEG